MDPLAQELNEIIQKQNPHVYSMLSKLGTSLFFPKGILAQSAEAQKKAKKYNATIGIATQGSEPMYLPCIGKYLTGLSPNDAYTYAPAAGKQPLREKWQEKLLEDNSSLRGKVFGLPIVTSGLTHGLDIAGDMFIDPGDVIILPDKFWENYSLLYGVRKNAEFRFFPLFNSQRAFNVDGFNKVVAELASEKRKIVTLFNFPNNPTGYTITPKEGEQIVEIINTTAKKNVNIVAIMDDAYFGLFYEDKIMQESLFGHLVNLNPRIVAVKLDGPTKEQFVWGFRVGFITYGVGGEGNYEAIYTALEKKTMGAIRSAISNCSHLAQSIVLKALNSPTYKEEKAEKVAILKKRALRTQEVLKTEKYSTLWEAYPFNSGYFMCLRLKKVEAETLRKHLLEKYGVGTIAMDTYDLRITFSSVEEENIQELFDLIAQGVKDLEK
ncbi:MAG: aminotransferase class I/II-fold pyridoxal phosphate-dependent enzyme [Pseudomonadota bacterium]